MKKLIAELNRTRRLGCEFEMSVPLVGTGTGRDVQQTLANVLSANGIRSLFRGYTALAVPEGIDVAVEYDGSIIGESRYQGIKWYPIEVKTRILNGIDEWEQIVPKTLEVCSYMGARVNHSTGFHIHVELMEARERPTVIRSLFNLFHRFEPVIYGLIAPSRSNNQYARAIPSEMARLFHGCRSEDSLCRGIAQLHPKNGLNLAHICYCRHLSYNPRVEFRYHHGTLSPIKARHWTRFCLAMMEHAVTRNCQSSSQVENTRRGLERLLVSCGFKVNSQIYGKVSAELRETGKWLIQRWKHFNGKIALRPKKNQEI